MKMSMLTQMEIGKMNKQDYIYFDPQNPEFCKKMVAKYGEDWHIEDFENDTSDDFLYRGDL